MRVLVPILVGLALSAAPRIEVSGHPDGVLLTIVEHDDSLELRIHSDRNRSISRYSEISPLAPSKNAPQLRRRDAETWYPVLDFHPDTSMRAVLRFKQAHGFYSLNGWVKSRKSVVTGEVVVAASDLLHWENSVWVEPAASALEAFYIRTPAKSLLLRPLSQKWTGYATLHREGREISRVIINKNSQPIALLKGDGLGRDLLLRSLSATVAFTLRALDRNPNSPTHGGLHIFYDLDAQTYRSSHWIWGYGPSVAMLLGAAKHVDSDARSAAKSIGEAALRSAKNEFLPGMPISRWERGTDYEYGHRGALTPADGGFLTGWAFVPLDEATGNQWLEAGKKTINIMQRLCRDFSVTPQNLWMDQGTWGDLVIDESGFATEGIAELYRVTKDESVREFGRLYMNQLLAKLERDDGLWDRGWSRAKDRRSETQRMTRGMGWAMEGLLANHRMNQPEGGSKRHVVWRSIC